MLVGVISDSHDRLPAIDRALALFKERGVEAIVHPGDIISPFAVRRLLAWQGPLHVTYGNNDGERAGLKELLPQITDGPLFVDLGGRRFLVHHFLDWCKPAHIDGADIVVTGHTHEVVNRTDRGKLYVNPGESCGWLSGRCTVAIVDTGRPSAQVCELDPP
jgi:putative phosphoesterase